ncbi:MAG: hypothetical protein KAX49_07755 [Halanaerobiales bacterium]|nr:hypothetical protein [Halanaerobiales bacterium]
MQVMKTLKIPLRKAVQIIHAYPIYSDIIRQTGKRAYIDNIEKNKMIKLMRRVILK